ncbi:hypothetical protein [Actinoalloteichus spitiensis]|uniref:hypothetical protein n=1 Tax=Actinoalloteichus spitiensis TaxID=252394 RepID=UPI00037B96CA|nr:hypothetical protein [Actinoalloteichus spitiensis]
MTDPLDPLLGLPRVEEAVRRARADVDAVHRHPANRRGWATTGAEASVRAARASAGIEGAAVTLPESGAVSDPVLAGALRLAEALGGLLPTWLRAPGQVLARMHVLAAADLVDEDDRSDLGRPRAGAEAAERLTLLTDLVAGGTRAPAPVLVAVVHGELLALRPFGTADGLVARAAARLTAIATGLDPKGLVVPEVAFLRRRDDYRSAAEGFASGDPEAVGRWIEYCCAALSTGATEANAIADALAG